MFIGDLRLLSFLLLLTTFSCTLFAVPINDVRIIGDDEDLPHGSIMGIYVLPWFEGAFRMPHDDEEGYYPRAFYGQLVDGVSQGVVGGPHASLVSQVVGCSTTDEFCDLMYLNPEIITPGYGRFVAFFFTHYTRTIRAFTDNDVIIPEGPHVGLFQSWKGNGVLQHSMLEDWQRGGLTIDVGGVPIDCRSTFICNKNLVYGDDEDDRLFQQLGMVPSAHQEAIMNSIADRTPPDSKIYIHNALGDHVMGWNEKDHGKIYGLAQNVYMSQFSSFILATSSLLTRLIASTANNPNYRANLLRYVIPGAGVGIAPPNGRIRWR